MERYGQPRLKLYFFGILKPGPQPTAQESVARGWGEGRRNSARPEAPEVLGDSIPKGSKKDHQAGNPNLRTLFRVLKEYFKIHKEEFKLLQKPFLTVALH